MWFKGGLPLLNLLVPRKQADSTKHMDCLQHHQVISHSVERITFASTPDILRAHDIMGEHENIDPGLELLMNQTKVQSV
jgi:hypothetical protein